jgi:hypothetical protein
MRTVYASVLDIVPKPPEPHSDCFRRLVDIATDWIAQGNQRKWGLSVELSFDGAEMNPAQGHRIRANHEKADSCELVTFEWSHPGDAGSDLIWNTLCNLARAEKAIQCSLVVRLTSPSAVVKPLTYSVGRPRLIGDILDAVPCFVGKQQVPKAAIEVAAPDVTKFVEGTLFSQERRLPVVVVSPDAWSGRPEVIAPDMQKALLGFAQVAALRDKWAAFKLTDAIGKDFSCYNGAVRLYWPGLKPTSQPLDHPLYFPDSIRWHAQNGQPLDRHLFRLLVGISSFRFSDASVVRAAHAAIDKAKQQHIQQLLGKAEAIGAETKEIEAELERAWDEIAQLKWERDEAKEQVSALSADLEAQKAAWATVQQAHTRPQSLPGPALLPAPGPSFKNLADVVAWAQIQFAETLLFLDSAVRSAEDSPYQHPERVSELLQALDELVTRWRSDGKLGESWKIALKKRGFDYNDNISITSRGKYGDDYTFVYEGKKRLFENHVTIGAKQPESCVSVHWMRDDKKKQIVIGWCGRHGTNTSS